MLRRTCKCRLDAADQTAGVRKKVAVRRLSTYAKCRKELDLKFSTGQQMSGRSRALALGRLSGYTVTAPAVTVEGELLGSQTCIDQNMRLGGSAGTSRIARC